MQVVARLRSSVESRFKRARTFSAAIGAEKSCRGCVCLVTTCFCVLVDSQYVRAIAAGHEAAYFMVEDQ